MKHQQKPSMDSMTDLDGPEGIVQENIDYVRRKIDETYEDIRGLEVATSKQLEVLYSQLRIYKRRQMEYQDELEKLLREKYQIEK